MIVKIPETSYTPADLLTMPDAAAYELVNGHLLERNVSALSSLVEGFIYDRIFDHVRKTATGLVWPSSMGYQCFTLFPEIVRVFQRRSPVDLGRQSGKAHGYHLPSGRHSQQA